MAFSLQADTNHITNIGRGKRHFEGSETTSNIFFARPASPRASLTRGANNTSVALNSTAAGFARPRTTGLEAGYNPVSNTKVERDFSYYNNGHNDEYDIQDPQIQKFLPTHRRESASRKKMYHSQPVEQGHLIGRVDIEREPQRGSDATDDMTRAANELFSEISRGRPMGSPDKAAGSPDLQVRRMKKSVAQPTTVEHSPGKPRSTTNNIKESDLGMNKRAYARYNRFEPGAGQRKIATEHNDKSLTTSRVNVDKAHRFERKTELIDNVKELIQIPTQSTHQAAFRQVREAVEGKPAEMVTIFSPDKTQGQNVLRFEAAGSNGQYGKQKTTITDTTLSYSTDAKFKESIRFEPTPESEQKTAKIARDYHYRNIHDLAEAQAQVRRKFKKSPKGSPVAMSHRRGGVFGCKEDIRNFENAQHWTKEHYSIGKYCADSAEENFPDDTTRNKYREDIEKVRSSTGGKLTKKRLGWGGPQKRMTKARSTARLVSDAKKRTYLSRGKNKNMNITRVSMVPREDHNGYDVVNHNAFERFDQRKHFGNEDVANRNSSLMGIVLHKESSKKQPVEQAVCKAEEEAVCKAGTDHLGPDCVPRAWEKEWDVPRARTSEFAGCLRNKGSKFSTSKKSFAKQKKGMMKAVSKKTLRITGKPSMRGVTRPVTGLRAFQTTHADWNIAPVSEEMKEEGEKMIKQLVQEMEQHRTLTYVPKELKRYDELITEQAQQKERKQKSYYGASASSKTTFSNKPKAAPKNKGLLVFTNPFNDAAKGSTSSTPRSPRDGRSLQDDGDFRASAALSTQAVPRDDRMSGVMSEVLGGSQSIKKSFEKPQRSSRGSLTQSPRGVNAKPAEGAESAQNPDGPEGLVEAKTQSIFHVMARSPLHPQSPLLTEKKHESLLVGALTNNRRSAMQARKSMNRNTSSTTLVTKKSSFKKRGSAAAGMGHTDFYELKKQTRIRSSFGCTEKRPLMGVHSRLTATAAPKRDHWMKILEALPEYTREDFQNQLAAKRVEAGKARNNHLSTYGRHSIAADLSSEFANESVMSRLSTTQAQSVRTKTVGSIGLGSMSNQYPQKGSSSAKAGEPDSRSSKTGELHMSVVKKQSGSPKDASPATSPRETLGGIKGSPKDSGKLTPDLDPPGGSGKHSPKGSPRNSSACPSPFASPKASPRSSDGRIVSEFNGSIQRTLKYIDPAVAPKPADFYTGTEHLYSSFKPETKFKPTARSGTFGLSTRGTTIGFAKFDDRYHRQKDGSIIKSLRNTEKMPATPRLTGTSLRTANTSVTSMMRASEPVGIASAEAEKDHLKSLQTRGGLSITILSPASMRNSSRGGSNQESLSPRSDKMTPIESAEVKRLTTSLNIINSMTNQSCGFSPASSVNKEAVSSRNRRYGSVPSRSPRSDGPSDGCAQKRSVSAGPDHQKLRADARSCGASSPKNNFILGLFKDNRGANLGSTIGAGYNPDRPISHIHHYAPKPQPKKGGRSVSTEPDAMPEVYQFQPQTRLTRVSRSVSAVDNSRSRSRDHKIKPSLKVSMTGTEDPTSTAKAEAERAEQERLKAEKEAFEKAKAAAIAKAARKSDAKSQRRTFTGRQASSSSPPMSPSVDSPASGSSPRNSARHSQPQKKMAPVGNSVVNEPGDFVLSNEHVKFWTAGHKRDTPSDGSDGERGRQTVQGDPTNSRSRSLRDSRCPPESQSLQNSRSLRESQSLRNGRSPRDRSPRDPSRSNRSNTPPSSEGSVAARRGSQTLTETEQIPSPRRIRPVDPYAELLRATPSFRQGASPSVSPTAKSELGRSSSPNRFSPRSRVTKPTSSAAGMTSHVSRMTVPTGESAPTKAPFPLNLKPLAKPSASPSARSDGSLRRTEFSPSAKFSTKRVEQTNLTIAKKANQPAMRFQGKAIGNGQVGTTTARSTVGTPIPKSTVGTPLARSTVGTPLTRSTVGTPPVVAKTLGTPTVGGKSLGTPNTNISGKSFMKNTTQISTRGSASLNSTLTGTPNKAKIPAVHPKTIGTASTFGSGSKGAARKPGGKGKSLVVEPTPKTAGSSRVHSAQTTPRFNSRMIALSPKGATTGGGAISSATATGKNVSNSATVSLSTSGQKNMSSTVDAPTQKDESTAVEKPAQKNTSTTAEKKPLWPTRSKTETEDSSKVSKVSSR